MVDPDGSGRPVTPGRPGVPDGAGRPLFDGAGRPLFDGAGRPAVEGAGPVRLVATDLDGTLLDPEGRIGERTRAALGAARRAGVAVVPVTGRPPKALWSAIGDAPLGPLAVCSNGAVILDVDRHEVIEVEAIAADVAVGLVQAVRAAAPGIVLATDGLEGFTFERGFFDRPVDWDQDLVEVDDITLSVAGGCLKLIGRRRGQAALDLVAVLEDRLADSARVTTSGLDWVDIGAAGVTKAWAVDRVCRHLGVSVHEVVAVGDNHNDLPVLAWAATAVAPANAIPEVLSVADRVVPSNACEGVALLLEEVATQRRGAPGPAAQPAG